MGLATASKALHLYAYHLVTRSKILVAIGCITFEPQIVYLVSTNYLFLPAGEPIYIVSPAKRNKQIF